MTERDEDRRIEEELQRRERNLRSERPTRQPQAAKPAGPPAAGPAPQPPDVEALVRGLKAELDDMEGRMAAGIDAVAEQVAPVPGAAADLAEWVRRATARGEAVDRLAPLLEKPSTARTASTAPQDGAPGRRGSCSRSRLWR